MKKKPDISSFVAGKDPSDFLEAGAGDRADRPKSLPAAAAAPVSQATPPDPTIQKLFRLRWDTANALKMGATQASIAGGKRVTETEIVEDLVRAHYGLSSLRDS